MELWFKHHLIILFFLLDNFQVLGFCVPDAVGPVSMVTELGDPLDTLRLLQFSWEDRLRVSTARLVRRTVHKMYV